MRKLLVLVLIWLSLPVSAQRARRVSIDEIKQRLINASWELYQIRNHVNEKVATTVEKKTITFTQDSVYLKSRNVTQVGVWEEAKLAFNVSNEDGKMVNYQWMYGSENILCLMRDNDKSRLDCYKKVK